MLAGDKKIFIFGYGISNKAAADKLIELGYHVTLDDDAADKIPDYYHKRPWQEVDLAQYDYLLLTPGVCLCAKHNHPLVDRARSVNLAIIGDVELFYLLNPKAIYIGVTGTNGKSTTVSLLYHILKGKLDNVYLGGNIGEPVFSLPIRSDAYYVFELSSFQLDLLDKTEIDHALILNITPDHLDRYIDFADYIKHKYRIYNLQTKEQNQCYIFADECYYEQNKELFSAKNKVTYLSTTSNKEDYYFSDGVVHGSDIDIPIDEDVILQVGHPQNLVGAVAIARSLGLKQEEIQERLPSFRALEHRLELISEYKNLRIFNDSKATNAESTQNALVNFTNVFWLAGGVAKDGGIKILKPYFHRVKKAYLFGKDAELFATQIGSEINYQKYESFKDAVLNSLIEALQSEGKVNLILSPACASFDMFNNYHERGIAFKKIVADFIVEDQKCS